MPDRKELPKISAAEALSLDNIRMKVTCTLSNNALDKAIEPLPEDIPSIQYPTRKANFSGKQVSEPLETDDDILSTAPRSKTVYLGKDDENIVVVTGRDGSKKPIIEEIEARNRFAQVDLNFARQHCPMEVQRGDLHENTFIAYPDGEYLAMERIEVGHVWEKLLSEYSVYRQLAQMATLFTDSGFLFQSNEGNVQEFYVQKGGVGRLDFGNHIFFDPSKIDEKEREIVFFRNFMSLVSQIRKSPTAVVPMNSDSNESYQEYKNSGAYATAKGTKILTQRDFDLLRVVAFSLQNNNVPFSSKEFVGALYMLEEISRNPMTLDLSVNPNDIENPFLRNLVRLDMYERIGKCSDSMQALHEHFMAEYLTTPAMQVEQLDRLFNTIVAKTIQHCKSRFDKEQQQKVSEILKRTFYSYDPEQLLASINELKAIPGLEAFATTLEEKLYPPEYAQPTVLVMLDGKSFNSKQLNLVAKIDSHYNPNSYSHQWLELFIDHADKELGVDVLRLVKSS